MKDKKETARRETVAVESVYIFVFIYYIEVLLFFCLADDLNLLLVE